jgi:hypothetical protein
VPYGERTPPPEGAPTAPPEVIGASLFLGLVAVLSISTQGSYLIALALGRSGLDLFALAGIGLNLIGFVASLWFLALRTWAWRLGLAFATIQVCLRVYLLVESVAPGVFHAGVAGPPNIAAALGQLLLLVVFLLVIAYMASAEMRELLRRREAYRRGTV